MSPQQTIAHYRIVSKLGEGGMGAVYRATDIKLNRDVAIKVLPDSFANDSGRLARFTREAQVLAALNHPNIAQIYGVEDRALVMELVEGAELKGPLPVDTAIACAKQLADALEAAHEKGIVHRDLKPANIKITPDGVLKVLDFGLAKASEESPSQTAASPTISPTLSLEMTQAGMILGTAAYMSPEQARGKAVDKRADIWAFGVIVYEMLTGDMLFRGETASDSMIAVATREPDWSALPADTPPHVRKLLARCLQKDPRRRLRDIGEARIALEQPDSTEAAAFPAQLTSRRRWLPWMAAIFTLVLGLAAGAFWRRPQPDDALTVRFALPYPEGTTQPGNPSAAQAVPSPDGRLIALTAISKGKRSIWLRPTASTEVRRLDGTDGASTLFWSPDGQFIAFFADDKLKKIPAAGGVAHTICDAPLPSSVAAGDGGDWNNDGIIVFATGAPGPLQRVSAAGGTPTAFTKLDASAGERKHSVPQFLPDGRHVLYYAQARDANKSGIYVQELGSEHRTLVMRNEQRAAWAPPGYLLFARETTLYAQAMDAKTFRLSGEAVPVAENVATSTINGRAGFAVSRSGVLVYRVIGAVGTGQLAWYSRDGKRLSAVGEPNRYWALRLSPDEKTVAVFSTESFADLTVSNLLTMDLSTGLVTPVMQNLRSPWYSSAWSPDSKRVAFNSRSEGVMEVIVASGQTRSLAKDLLVDDWSPDGQFLICEAESGRQTVLLAPSPGAKPQTVSSNPSPRARFAFSPDGKFVAFASQESRRSEVWVAVFPSFAEKRQISADGGNLPMWRRDGKELFFRGPDGFIMSAEITTAGKIQSTVPKPLFQTSDPSYPFPRFAPSGDGKRFLVFESTPDEAALRVVVNWAAELKK